MERRTIMDKQLSNLINMIQRDGPEHFRYDVLHSMLRQRPSETIQVIREHLEDGENWLKNRKALHDQKSPGVFDCLAAGLSFHTDLVERCDLHWATIACHNTSNQFTARECYGNNTKIYLKGKETAFFEDTVLTKCLINAIIGYHNKERFTTLVFNQCPQIKDLTIHVKGNAFLMFKACEGLTFKIYGFKPSYQMQVLSEKSKVVTNELLIEIRHDRAELFSNHHAYQRAEELDLPFKHILTILTPEDGLWSVGL